MKILWICNIELPIISEALNKEVDFGGGWMDIISRSLVGEGHELHVIYANSEVNKTVTLDAGAVTAYQIPHKRRNNSYYDKRYEGIFRGILKGSSFDCIHIWGEELPRTLSLLKVCKELNLLDRTIVEIQGIRHFIAKNFYASLPNRIIRRKRLHDIYLNNSIKNAKRRHERAGKYELESIRTTKNIMGRTDWDLACVKSINPEVNYYKCNRILRKSFSENQWELDKCSRYSLLASSYGDSAKGLHYVIEAMPIILQEFPEAHLYVVGYYTPLNSLKAKLKLNGYGKYIYELIDKYNLENNVTFLSSLNEAKMCEQTKNTHVCISASTMEDAPNTVAEAMKLGVPVVSSLVGGVASMVDHGVDGFLYQYDAPYMMAFYVKEIFRSDALALSLSENAKKRAKKAYDTETNYNTLLNVYRKLSEQENG
ncbi:MAG: glycosyltransferase family 4 protein [Clostridia bacterium]|nr:glycosyltransferase family 4 protein [Clostridia bacterium]